jgi:hypothetical protein
VFRKTLSVEAEDFFGNLTCHLNRSKPLKVRCREIANLIIQDVKLTNSKRSLKVQRGPDQGGSLSGILESSAGLTFSSAGCYI